MPDYELTPDAEVDLHDIALYTLKTWGIEQTNRYEAALENNLKGIGAGETRTRPVFEHRSDLRVSRCEHHYVFAQMREKRCSADRGSTARENGPDGAPARTAGRTARHRGVADGGGRTSTSRRLPPDCAKCVYPDVRRLPVRPAAVVQHRARCRSPRRNTGLSSGYALQVGNGGCRPERTTIGRRDIATLHHELRATPIRRAALCRHSRASSPWPRSAACGADGTNTYHRVNRFREGKRERFLSDPGYSRLAAALKESEETGPEPPLVLAAVGSWC